MSARIIPVTVVVPPRVLLLDVAGPVEVLRKANLAQDRIRFAVTYVGPSASVASSIGLGVTGVQPLPDSLPDGTLLVVPGAADEPMGEGGNRRSVDAAMERSIVRWLEKTVRPGVRLVTICSGALLAAHAGLFDGHECTTHHATIDTLAAAAPRARVLQNRLYVEDGDRLSSAGITAGVDLMLHIVSQLAGPVCATEVARYLVVYLRRAGGDPQLSPWLEGRNHLHPAVHRAQDAISADPARHWTVPALARKSATSARHLSRLFNAHAGMSVPDYVNRMRIDLARQLLRHSGLDIERIAERAGFTSARQFRRVWRKTELQVPSRSRLTA